MKKWTAKERAAFDREFRLIHKGLQDIKGMLTALLWWQKQKAKEGKS